MNMHIPSRQNIFREMRDYLMIALGMIMYGIGWTVFLLPNDITTGGVPGIASLVYFATGLPVQYVYFGINFLLLLLAIRILGWKFSIKTIFAVFTLTSFLPIIQQLTDGVHLLNDQPFMACVIGASFCGGGIGIAFSSNGSTGGTDIIAAIINKYRDITLGDSQTYQCVSSPRRDSYKCFRILYRQGNKNAFCTCQKTGINHYLPADKRHRPECLRVTKSGNRSIRRRIRQNQSKIKIKHEELSMKIKYKR